MKKLNKWELCPDGTFKCLWKQFKANLGFNIALIIMVLVFVLCVFVGANAQTATYYHDKYEGRKTSNGDIFRQNKLTCASNDHRFGNILRITYKDKFIDVRVNDRLDTPIHNVIDLSKLAFTMLADTPKGRIKIKIKIIKK